MNITVIGGSGYTGGELLRYLSVHPKVNEITVTSTQHAGKTVIDLHPNLDIDVKFSELDYNLANGSDLVFCCVPHTKAMEIVPKISTKVIDLSADFRLNDAKLYESAYNVKHTSPELLDQSVYGLPELNREKIKKARIVANPGCFPTGAILGAYPLVKNFEVERLVIDSKTGISGAGRGAKDVTHFPNINENVIPYKSVNHQHIAEIEQSLGKKVYFTPHMVPITRGILSTIHAFTDADPLEVFGEYEHFYRDEPFVRVGSDIPAITSVNGSNFCRIGGISGADGRIVIFSVIDNLGKGASSQAVQNMNIMQGFDEKTGLSQIAGNP